MASAELVVLSDVEPARNRALVGALGREGIDVALRGGNIRISPHVYNRVDDVERAVDVLRSQPA